MVIYMIENKTNNKKYIGSTKDLNKRIKEHFYSAICSTTLSHNYPLQKAIRKYG